MRGPPDGRALTNPQRCSRDGERWSAPEAQDADAGDAPLDATATAGRDPRQGLLEFDAGVAHQQTRVHARRITRRVCSAVEVDGPAPAAWPRAAVDGVQEASSVPVLAHRRRRNTRMRSTCRTPPSRRSTPRAGRSWPCCDGHAQQGWEGSLRRLFTAGLGGSSRESVGSLAPFDGDHNLIPEVRRRYSAEQPAFRPRHARRCKELHHEATPWACRLQLCSVGGSQPSEQALATSEGAAASSPLPYHLVPPPGDIRPIGLPFGARRAGPRPRLGALAGAEAGGAQPHDREAWRMRGRPRRARPDRTAAPSRPRRRGARSPAARSSHAFAFGRAERRSAARARRAGERVERAARRRERSRSPRSRSRASCARSARCAPRARARSRRARARAHSSGAKPRAAKAGSSSSTNARACIALIRLACGGQRYQRFAPYSTAFHAVLWKCAGAPEPGGPNAHWWFSNGELHGASSAPHSSAVASRAGRAPPPAPSSAAPRASARSAASAAGAHVAPRPPQALAATSA